MVEVPQREAICAALDTAQIDWGIHYPIPIQRQPAYADASLAPRPTPHAEALAGRILSLPMFAEITPAEVDRVADAVLAAIKPGA